VTEPTSGFDRGGFLPGDPVRVTLDPAECIIKPDGDCVWRCVRGDAAHVEAGHDLVAGVDESGEWRPAPRPPLG
jgi:hypothetical protein